MKLIFALNKLAYNLGPKVDLESTIFILMHELMFHAGVKGMSEQSELIPWCMYGPVGRIYSTALMQLDTRSRATRK